eukprot:TRINITY_DN18476_c0_g1_i1.p1 TRINITY_DN18476_c0_g1~~TRINITY_DN18476_c0_g1_i1.p1  ORF type:complete len:166 (-),score=17.71 TRINITY_DN18476_c0_g1_i1:40-537(-)
MLALDLKLIRFVAVISEVNSHCLFLKKDEWSKFRPDGSAYQQDAEDCNYALAYYEKSAIFNHSCAPNIYKIHDGLRISFHALREIDRGEECVQSYIPLHENAATRQTRLQRAYSFSCDCIRCTDSIADLDFIDEYICSDLDCFGLLAPVLNEPDVKKCTVCGYYQ